MGEILRKVSILQGPKAKSACWENLKNLNFYSGQKIEQWLKRSVNSLALNMVCEDLNILSGLLSLAQCNFSRILINTQ